jgi:hypothetical protein
MPRITVHAVNSAGEPRRWTLSERIFAENLDSDHYIAQLIQRLAWATADAEAQESRSNGRRSGHAHSATAGGAELDARSKAPLPRSVAT